MIGAASAWERLGLEPTHDVRAIRKAYSSRLKAIDVDADPAAFIALRQALEQAAAMASRVAAEPTETPPPDADRAKPAAPAAQTPVSDDQRDRGRLYRLLTGNEDIEASAPEIVTLTAVILERVSRERIDRIADFEAWVAGLIANTMPRSDAMIDSVVDYFHWREHAADWRRDSAVETVLQRQTDLVFRASIASRQSRWNRAFLALKGPGPLMPGGRIAADVRDLLTLARDRHPTLMRDFAPEAVAWWSKRIQRRSKLKFRFLGNEASWILQFIRSLIILYLKILSIFAFVGASISVIWLVISLVFK